MILEQYSNFCRSPVLLLCVFISPSSCTKISVPNDLRKPFPSNLGPPRVTIFKISFNLSYDLDATSPHFNLKSVFQRKAFLSIGVQTYALNSISVRDCVSTSFL